MKNQITLSLITAGILGLTGCGGDSAPTTTPSEASSLIQANSSVALENKASLEVAVEVALEKNTNKLKANGLVEEVAQQESKKFTSTALGKLNLDELEAAVLTECNEDEKCKEEAYASFTGALTDDKEEAYSSSRYTDDKEEAYSSSRYTGSLIMDKEEAYAIAQDIRDNGKEEAYAINDGLVKEFACEAGELKTVQHYGLEDNFSSANDDENATASQQVQSNSGVMAYNNGIGLSNYDTTQVNRQFGEEIKNLPSNITKGMFYIGLDNHGANDRITIGNMDTDANTLDFFGEEVLDLDSTFSWNKNAHVYSQSFANIGLRDSTSLKNYVQTNNKFDVYVQDDTYVDFITVATCSKPDPIKEITAIVNEFECSEKETLVKIFGGEIDNFTGGTDTTSPSSALVSATTSPTTVYDSGAHDRHFIDTLNISTNLPTGSVLSDITKAEFSIGYQSTNRSLWTNDGLYLGEYGTQHAGQHLYDTNSPFYLPNIPSWNRSIVNGETIAQSDLSLLANNTPSGTAVGTVFDSILTNGFLDVYLQDDTNVDFTQLNLCVAEACGKDVSIDLSQLANWTNKPADAVENNVFNNTVNEGVWDNTLNWFDLGSTSSSADRTLDIPFCACGDIAVNIAHFKADNNATIKLNSTVVVSQQGAGQASMRRDDLNGNHVDGATALSGTGTGVNHTLRLDVHNNSNVFGAAVEGTLDFRGYLGKCQ